MLASLCLFGIYFAMVLISSWEFITKVVDSFYCFSLEVVGKAIINQHQVFYHK